MKFKNFVVVALLATSSFTFADDTKKTEVKDVQIQVLNTTVNQEVEDHCSITLTVTRITTVGNTTFEEEIDATGTGTTCEEAEADARARLNS